MGSMTARARALVLLATIGITFATLSPPASATTALPDSIAAIGDSITRATNAAVSTATTRANRGAPASTRSAP
jgi:hypothetical protein